MRRCFLGGQFDQGNMYRFFRRRSQRKLEMTIVHRQTYGTPPQKKRPNSRLSSHLGQVPSRRHTAHHSQTPRTNRERGFAESGSSTPNPAGKETSPASCRNVPNQNAKSETAGRTTNCDISRADHDPRHHLPSGPFKPTYTVQEDSLTADRTTKR